MTASTAPLVGPRPVVPGETPLAPLPSYAKFPPPAQAAAASRPRLVGTSRDLLVVVAGCQDLDTVALAVAQALETGGRAVIALARRRPPFTTDRVVARHAARRLDEEELHWRHQALRLLEGADVPHQFLRLTYRDSRSASRRRRRITASAQRLARRHVAELVLATTRTIVGDSGRGAAVRWQSRGLQPSQQWMTAEPCGSRHR